MTPLLLVVLLAAAGPDPSALGLQALRHGKVEEAVKHLEVAVKQAPYSAAVRTDYGYALVRAGRRREAEKAFRQAIQLEPSRVHAYINLVDLVVEDADWSRREDLRQLLAGALPRFANGPGRAAVVLRLAALEQALGRPVDARVHLDGLEKDALSPVLRRRWQAVRDALDTDQLVRSLDDWPEPMVPASAQVALDHAQEALRRGNPAAALATLMDLDACCAHWSAARQLRARALVLLERYEEAVRELLAMVQLRPSDARAWRDLGLVLSDHGGLLEAERADAALREALALEPGWSELWLVRARLALRRRRGEDAVRHLARLEGRVLPGSQQQEFQRVRSAASLQVAEAQRAAPTPVRAPPPTPSARDLYRDAQPLLASVENQGAAEDLLRRAVEDSPAFVEAAAALFALRGSVPEATLAALDGDSRGLLDLARAVALLEAPAGKEAAEAVAARCLDRSVELGCSEALLERARFRAARGHTPEALEDLEHYVNVEADPDRLATARRLRSELQPVPASAPIPDGRLARFHLAADKPELALAALGSCGADQPRPRLLALGRVHEFAGSLGNALECYALAASPASAAEAREAGARLAEAAGEAPLPEVLPHVPVLQDVLAHGGAAAAWPLARVAEEQGRWQEALELLDAMAPVSGGRAVQVREARERLEAALHPVGPGLTPAGRAALAGLLLLLGGVAWRAGRGRTVAEAVVRCPELHPEVARTVGELRHDVLKHRASVVDLLPGAAEATRRDVLAALEQPEPAEDAVAAAYARLDHAARHAGVRLRSLAGEPVFGPLHRDLRDARLGALQPRRDHKVKLIAQRLTSLHPAALAELLRLGPRTRVDAAVVTAWVRAVEVERRRAGARWTAPSLFLQEAEVEFPVERQALATVFANLLRNAQAAVEADAEGRVLVRLAEERDGAGRRVKVLLVGDSNPATVTLEQIDNRESGRGLAITRDLVRQWRGHVVVRREEQPWTKGIGACFPA